MSTPARISRPKPSAADEILSPSALNFDISCRIKNDPTESNSPGGDAEPEAVHEFKLIIVGDAGVGKTSFVQRVKTGIFQRRYECTRGADASTLTFDTNRGIVKFHTWDTAGVESCAGLGDGYFVESKAAIIMFDLESRTSYKNVSEWHKKVIRVCPDIPIILLGNKADSKNRKVKSGQMAFMRKIKCKYYETSVKMGSNMTRPLLRLARILMGDSTLEFVAKAAVSSLDLVSDDAQTDNEDAKDVPSEAVAVVEKTGKVSTKGDLSAAVATPLPDGSGNGDGL